MIKICTWWRVTTYFKCDSLQTLVQKDFSLEPASPLLSAAAAETVWREDVNSRQASYLAFLPCQMHQRQEITQLAKIYHTVSPKVKTGFSYSKANAVFCHR